MKHETHYAAKLASQLESELWGSVVFTHHAEGKAGIPDLSVTWAKRTTWVEVKLFHGGRLIRTKQQTKRLIQLARAGLGIYVIFDERFTRIVDPISNHVLVERPGIDYDCVVVFIRRTHAA